MRHTVPTGGLQSWRDAQTRHELAIPRCVVFQSACIVTQLRSHWNGLLWPYADCVIHRSAVPHKIEAASGYVFKLVIKTRPTHLRSLLLSNRRCNQSYTATVPDQTMIHYALLGLSSLVVVVIWRLLYPKPYPGIPHVTSSAKRISGDIPDLMSTVQQTDEITNSMFAVSTQKLGMPIAQVLFPRFRQPLIVLEDH